MDRAPDPSRRRTLKAVAAGVLLGACTRSPADAPAIEDVSRLESYPVARVARPTSAGEVEHLLREWTGPVCIGGGRYSMGGQIAAPRALHLDMRGLRRLVALDPLARTVRVEAGMRWRDLLDHLDPHDLSIAIMQSYSNFTVGGSVGVNCHGRYVGKGPLVNSIRALRLVDAMGAAHELSRQREPELFAAVVGGYGGLGVVTEVELDLASNTPMRRELDEPTLDEYPDWFRARVLGAPDVLLHNADLVPPAFDAPLAISWRLSADLPTIPARLVAREREYRSEQALIRAASELPAGPWMLERLRRQMREEPAPVVWRNHEASLDTDMLEPATRAFSTFVLQEYFVPVEAFLEFARGMAAILRASDANVLNVSIRHSPADRASLLRWAADECFCFVLYLKQRRSAVADASVAVWTRRLIDLALQLGGRHYLPYRLHATPEQFRAAYPAAARFAALKREVDPGGRFRNALWSRYLG